MLALLLLLALEEGAHGLEGRLGWGVGLGLGLGVGSGFGFGLGWGEGWGWGWSWWGRKGALMQRFFRSDPE